MANANFLNQIREHMDKLQKEYNALSEAYKILSVTGGPGRRPSVPSLFLGGGDSSKGSSPSRKGKRGRPPGAKNKPGYKKPGPKPKKDVAAAVSKSAPAKKARGKKRRAAKSTRSNSSGGNQEMS